jgi:16S rRNA (uracil1498-N3)-methyltransferase
MLPRFLAPELPGHVFALPPEESAHAARVLRLRRGDELLVFDGHGRQVRASVERIDRGAVHVRALGPAPAVPEPAVSLTLLQSVLKTAAMDEVIRNATMMGVSSIQPVVSTHSTVTLPVLVRRHSVARWQRVAVSAAKQCGRAVVPAIRQPEPFEAATAGPVGTSIRLLLVEPAAHRPSTRSVRSIAGARRPASALVAVGPEGGWTPKEVARAEADGFVTVGLGGRVLRADAVSLAAIAVLQFVWGDL